MSPSKSKEADSNAIPDETSTSNTDTPEVIQNAPQESDLEKPPFVFTTKDASGNEEAIPEDDPRVADIPHYVRRIVSFEDDPTLPTLTFRYFVLTIFFVVPGAFLSMMSHFRTTYAPYSVFFVQIASSYAGVWLADILPAWTVKVPFTSWGFSLNPGPFSVKEHVLITISAASGATYNLGYAPVAMAELYFGQKVNPAVAIFFMWAIVWTGYSFAAIARQFLIYDPQYPWFTAYVFGAPNAPHCHVIPRVVNLDCLSAFARRPSSKPKRSNARTRRRSPASRARSSSSCCWP